MLECDGTEVDGEAFDDVKSETLLLLKQSEQWRQRGATNGHVAVQQLNVEVVLAGHSSLLFSRRVINY